MLKVLESPTSWNAFRTAGGFDGVLSLLGDMEGALRAGPGGVWAWLCPERVRELVLLSLYTVALAVHLHPVNAHFFHTAQHHAKMADALLQLGCFSESQADCDADRGPDCNHGINPDRGTDCGPDRNRGDHPDCNADRGPDRDHGDDPDRDPVRPRTFHQFVEEAVTPGSSLPPPFRDCVRLLSFLDQFAMGTFVAMEFPASQEEHPELPDGVPAERELSSPEVDSQGSSRSAPGSDPGRRYDP